MVAQVTTYTVHAEKHDGWWLLTSPDAPGAVSQVRALSQADAHAREATAFVRGVSQDDVEVEVVAKLPERLQRKVAAVKRSQREAEKVQRAAAARSRDAVAELRAAGFKGAEVAVVLGLSPQRVSQLSRDRQPASQR